MGEKKNLVHKERIGAPATVSCNAKQVGVSGADLEISEGTGGGGGSE